MGNIPPFKHNMKQKESQPTSLLEHIAEEQNTEEIKRLMWEGGYDDYLGIVQKDPAIVRNAFQRLHDMIVSYGTTKRSELKEEITSYHFFSDPFGSGQDAVFGLDKPLMELVRVLKAAADCRGPEKRMILLEGPVGSSKSTIVRLFKRGLEEYTRKDEGKLYSFSWNIENDLYQCPMNEEPLLLLPKKIRPAALSKIFSKDVDPRNPAPELKHLLEGEVCPHCRFWYKDLERKYGGDLKKILSHVKVHRLVFSEADRVGIATMQPKSEKDQDATELTGDINYRKVAQYGADSDPRAFSFDGELNVANRGIAEFIEILKLDVAFLYDLLGATQEHSIKPKKFAQTHIDEVIIGHTNEPEYEKLVGNKFMEALRDRTIKITIPYAIKLDDEVKIYKKTYGNGKVRGRHIAPHTIEMASLWAVLTRLEDPDKADITLLQKAKLYNGKILPGYTPDNIKELKDSTEKEGKEGVSPRYIQDKISNALTLEGYKCVNPFMVLKELEMGLKNHSVIGSAEARKTYTELFSLVKREYEDIVKNEVQKAISGDVEAIQKLCSNYIDNLKAYSMDEKVKNPYTGEDEEPDERLMRSIEEKIGIDEGRQDDFRRELMNYIAKLALEGKKFNYQSNERLNKALELKLFEDKKDVIKLSSMVSSVVDDETQKKIDILKQRMIKDFGYCEVCSNDVLIYVASIFARGSAKN